MQRSAVWIALVLLVSYLQFVGGGWFGIYESGLRLTSLALVGLVLGGWAIAAARNQSLRPDTSLRVPIVIGLASLALSTIASLHSRISVEYLAYAVVLVSLYLLLVQLLRSSFLSGRFGILAVFLTIVIAGAYLGAVVGRWAQWLALVGHLTVPPLRPAFESFVYGNPSSVMAVVVMLLFSGIATLGFDTIGRRVLGAVLVVLAASVTLASGSRAGWLAVAATLVVVAVVVMARPEGRRAIAGAARAATGGRSAKLVLGALLTAGGGGLLVFGPAILVRVLASGQILRGSFTLEALRMFAEAPLLGLGPGMWVAQRIRFTVAPDIDYYIPHAHNMYAQVLAELGIVGALAGFVLLIWLVRLVLGAIRGEDAVRRRWGYAALAASVYFGVHSTLDVFTNMPAILFPLALPIAWLDATRERPEGGDAPIETRPRHIPTGVAGIAGVGAVASALVILLATEIPAYQGHLAVSLANEGRWSEAAPLAVEAVRNDPGMPALRFTLGLALDRVGDHAGSAGAFRDVAEGDDLPEAWLNLAAEEAMQGRSTVAIDAIHNALRLGYQRPAVAMPAGELALELGARDMAVSAFTSAIITTPSLAADPFWSADPGRMAVFTDVVREATRRVDPSRAWEISLMVGDPATATAMAAMAGDPALAAMVVKAWNGDAGSVSSIAQRCEANPLDLTALMWCARLAGKAGDLEAADHYRLEAGYIQGGAGEAGAELRVATEPGIGRWMSGGGSAEFWGYYTYRRPTPWDILVPSLVHLVTE